jgi:xanthine dehydrogenase YagS FAD-binding subunit
MKPMMPLPISPAAAMLPLHPGFLGVGAAHATARWVWLTPVVLPPPKTGEQSAYMRAISRARAEWPLVEVLARVGVENGAITWARIAVGHVAPRPLRLHAVETALVGAPADASALADIAAKAKDGAKPPPMTGYKLELLQGSIIEALERALASKPVGSGGA